MMFIVTHIIIPISPASPDEFRYLCAQAKDAKPIWLNFASTPHWSRCRWRGSVVHAQ